MNDASEAAAALARRSWSGRRKPKLSSADKDAIRDDYAAGGVTLRELAERWGVSESMVSLVVRGLR